MRVLFGLWLGEGKSRGYGVNLGLNYSAWACWLKDCCTVWVTDGFLSGSFVTVVEIL